MSRYELHLGDCLEVMKSLPENSVDSIVTDPPYGIRFMGKSWDGADIEARVAYRDGMPSRYTHCGPNGGHSSRAAEAGKYDLTPAGMLAFQQFTLEWAKEALRVLKPGGHLLSFSSARTYHHMAVGIEMAGFEIRDQLMWVFGSGFPKSHNLSGEFEGWGTGLKPAHEPICMARKPLKGTVAENMAMYTTGAINIALCRIGAAPGRWPANLIHDGSDEVVALFPANAGAAAPVHKRNGDKFRNSYGEFKGNIDEGGSTFYGDSGSAARFFYCPKATRKDRNEGLEDPGPQFKHGTTLRKVENTQTKGNIHPTVKPTDLMAYLCRLVTPAGGVVLDPFVGSGSTGKAALREGFRFIGIELEAGYFEIAQARIAHEAGKGAA